MATKKKETPADEIKEVEAVEEQVEETVEDVAEVDPEAYFNELVPFYAFRDSGKYKDDIVVGVNGKIWRIQRGVQVMIPRKVYNVLERSMGQDAATADLIYMKASEFEAEAKRWR